MWIKTTFDKPEEPEDIVEALRQADEEYRRRLEGAMIIDPQVGPSLYARAAAEIEKLRAIVGIVDN